MKKKSKEQMYFISMVKEAQRISYGRKTYIYEKKEIDMFVDFFLKYGWLPKKLFDEPDEICKVCGNPKEPTASISSICICNDLDFCKSSDRIKILKNILEKSKNRKKVIEKPKEKLYVCKVVMRVRKRPKEIGGNYKDIL